VGLQVSATAESSSVDGTPQSRAPARARLEYRLRRGGLSCAVDGYSRWQRFAVDLARAPKALPLTVLVLCYVCVSAAWIVWNDGITFKFFIFLPFDALAPIALVCFVVVGGVVSKRRNEDARARMKWSFLGLSVASLAAFVPYLAFTRARLDARLAGAAGAPHSVVHASEAGLLLHFALMALIGAVIVVELKTGVFTTLFSLTTVALRAAPRTVVDVLQTLPLVLTVLFFVAFTHDTWETFGLLSPQQLVLLVLLLFGCVVCVVIRAARDEVQKLDEPADSQAIVPDDVAVRELKRAGVPVEPLRVDRTVRKALERQWTFQISLCVLAAGIIVACLIWIAGGLAMNRSEVKSWLDNKVPSKVIDATVWKVHVFLTWQGLVVALMLGAFASLVFAGVAISQNDSRGELFKGERARLGRMLLLAGMYKNAVRRGLWGGRPGMTWPTYYAFLADEPERWHTEPVEFGSAWHEEGSSKQWRAAWNETTGEFYVYRRKTSPVEVLAICRERAPVDAALEGWDDHQLRHDSLRWLRAQAKGLAAVAQKPAGRQ